MASELSEDLYNDIVAQKVDDLNLGHLPCDAIAKKMYDEFKNRPPYTLMNHLFNVEEINELGQHSIFGSNGVLGDSCLNSKMRVPIADMIKAFPPKKEINAMEDVD